MNTKQKILTESVLKEMERRDAENTGESSMPAAAKSTAP